MKNPQMIQSIMGQAIQQTKAAYLFLQRDQLYQGKNAVGEDITPSYLNDPYFKDREAAQRYSDWKDDITPDPRRKKGTPNIFITGFFHETLDIFSEGSDIRFTVGIPDVVIKYGPTLLGLNPTSRALYVTNVLGDAWIELVKKQLNL